MAKTVQKITLSASRDIPFNKLVLSQSNVRRLKAGLSIEELAEDIARRTLLQSLSVRPVLDADGAETGMFEIPAGGPPLPGTRTSGQAEAPGQDRAGPLRGARSQRRGFGGRGFVGRKPPACRPTSAGSVSVRSRRCVTRGAGDEEIAARFLSSRPPW